MHMDSVLPLQINEVLTSFETIYRDGWMKLLADEVHVQGMTVLLVGKVHEQEPQLKWLHFIQPSLHK